MRSEEGQLTGGEVPIVVDDRVEEVRLPGVFCVPHRAVIKEDVLVRSREISAVLHVDDEEPMPGLPSCDSLQLSQHLHGELLQVLKCCGIPGGNGKGGGQDPQCCGRGERRVHVGVWVGTCASISSKKQQSNSVQTLIALHISF